MQTTTHPQQKPTFAPQRHRRVPIHTTVDVDVTVYLDDISTADLVLEIERRGASAAPIAADEARRIYTLHLCGQRDQAAKEALELVLLVAASDGAAGC